MHQISERLSKKSVIQSSWGKDVSWMKILYLMQIWPLLKIKWVCNLVERQMETMQENCPREAQMQSLGNSGWDYQGEFLVEARQEV